LKCLLPTAFSLVNHQITNFFLPTGP